MNRIRVVLFHDSVIFFSPRKEKECNYSLLKLIYNAYRMNNKLFVFLNRLLSFRWKLNEIAHHRLRKQRCQTITKRNWIFFSRLLQIILSDVKLSCTIINTSSLCWNSMTMLNFSKNILVLSDRYLIPFAMHTRYSYSSQLQRIGT